MVELFLCQILHKRVFHTDNAETIFTVLSYLRDDRFFRLFRALFTIHGHHQIENQIHVRFPDGHTKIVQAIRGVHRFYRVHRDVVHFVDKGVVHHNRVKVYGDNATEFCVHITFKLIDFLMRYVDVGIGRYFRMEGNNLSAGTIIVHHNVVDTDYVGVGFYKIVNSVDKFGGGGRTK